MATTVAGFPRGISFARSARARRTITIALIAGWGIVTVLWAGYARSGKQVLVLARDIPAGQSIGAGDLRTETVGASTQIADVPATQLNQVVGERPTENLRAGALLDRRSLTSQPVLGAAEVALPLTLDSDQSASGMLRAGENVSVVGGGGLGSAGASTPKVLAPVARVLAVAPSEASGKIVVTVALSSPDVAAQILAVQGLGGVGLVILSSPQ